MKYNFGSNYVPVEITMSIREKDKDREVIGTIDDAVDYLGNLIQEYNQKFKIFWPLNIYPCQKIDLFGAKMYAAPSFQVRTSQMIWFVSSLLFHVETLWNIILKSEM